MKIKSIRIENFRSFLDATIDLGNYTCLVGPNGAGKSTVLAALNIFFQDRSSSVTDVSRLADEDYFAKDTSRPIRITLVMTELSDIAKDDLAGYVRQNELVVSAEATFDAAVGYGSVRHYGQRFGMEDFRPFFEAEKSGAKAQELATIFDGLTAKFPALPTPRSKDEKAAALRDFEANNPQLGVLIPSADDFYGVNSTGKLARHLQWVYVPAVKDAGDEALEGKNTALGKIIARTVRNKLNFDAEIEELKAQALGKYKELLDKNRVGLEEISKSLQSRLESWAHPDAKLGMEWLSDPLKSVVVQAPIAGLKAGEGGFIGSISRMGHGLQRSYLLALLQELANSDAPDSPTLILGCEEPELYQHPPQARYLSDVFEQLSSGNNQVIVTTHSPLFVSGDGFENTKVVQRGGVKAGSKVVAMSFAGLCARVRDALGEEDRRPKEGLIAKIQQSLQPGLAEMFFAKVPVLVEGLEDVSYITTALHLSGRWGEFRRLGCHLVPANGKDKIIQPLAMAVELGIPVFVIFDADGNVLREDHRVKHQRDNRALQRLLGCNHPEFPADVVIERNYAIWPTNLADEVRADMGGQYDQILNAARARYGNEGGLEKNDLFIADWLSAAWLQNVRSATLGRLCDEMLKHASQS